jgi:hydroxymethylbilane synthase
MKMRKIRVGTRGSNLALWQADFVRQSLEKLDPGTEFEQVIIKTDGDLDLTSSLSRIGGQGVFTKEIEKALLSDQIDIAVHSLKDLPSKMPEGLMLGAVPERGPVEDILITESGCSLKELPEKSRIATGSIRRKSQLLHKRPDLQVSDLRGNIDTRIRKLKDQGIDGIIMARAAIIRLKLEGLKYAVFPTGEMIPAVGQGAIGIQVRSDDPEIRDKVRTISHDDSFHAVKAERALLSTLDSGCQFPVGCIAEVSGDILIIRGFVASEDGRIMLYDKTETRKEDSEKAGRMLAESLIRKGAKSILDTFSLT